MNQILEALDRQAMNNPQQLAFVGQSHQGSYCSISYQDLKNEVEAIANVFRSMKMRCIALRAENSVDWVVIDLAAMKAQVSIVPVPTFFSEQQVAHTLKETQADYLIGDWESDNHELTRLRGMPVYSSRTKATDYSAEPFLAVDKVLPGTCKITFTSGSTGQPKGVCLSEQNLVTVAVALAKSMQSGGNVPAGSHLAFIPLSTLLENITSVYVPLLLGKTSLVYQGQRLGLIGSSHLDFIQFAKALAEFYPSSMVITPAILMALIQIVAETPSLAQSFSFIAVGGARVAPELIEKAHQLNLPVYEGYGLSEMASVVALNTAAGSKPETSGQLLEHLEAKVTEDNELLVRGNVALGYLGEPFESTWFKTGDLASIDDDGYITVVGRKKNQIITGFGRNVSPEWVESQAQVYAPGYSVIVTGDEQMGLTAIIEEDEGIEDRMNALNRSLPDYARIANLLVVSDLFSRTTWFTSNGRPKRTTIESWARCVLDQTIIDPSVSLKTLKTQFGTEELRSTL
ncbi:AMP-binding protein [Vibrio sp. S4M6]|uniref:AMP-binding protein n=1 Tax=Vibrio sinus TaxID=2946865 RepID=UPI00202A75B9|nr:AMP-binding protein [Vibrio sinus]MCL9781991.1 AMP-binding protein [Vibrio sinus]